MLFFALGSLLSGVSASAEFEPRKIVLLGAPDLTARLQSELSKESNFVLLDRDQWMALLKEQTLSDAGSSSRVQSAEFFLLAGESEKQIHVQLVRAGSSELLAEALLPGVEAVRPWLNIAESFRPGDPIEFALAVLDGGSPEARLSAISLREELRDAGFRILGRDRVEDLLREGEDLAAGFRSPGEMQPAGFRGADVLLVLEDTNSQVRVLAADGGMLGRRDLDSKGIAELLTFLESKRAGNPRWIAAQYQQRVSAEALEKYYRGIELMESGFPLEAVEPFQQATELNNQWIEAYLAEARCYDLAGLPELAAVLRRWVARGFLGRGTAAAANSQARNGLTFLGVASTKPAQSDQARTLTLSAINQLAGPELLLPETLQSLAREMDLVTLGQQGEGVRWTTSPGFVSERVLRAVVDGDNCRWILSNELAGTTLAVYEHKLSDSPSEDLGWLDDFVSSPPMTAPATKPSSVHLPTPQELRTKIGPRTRAQENNLLLLQALLLLPEDPFTIGGQLNKSARERGGLDQFMDFGKREVLLRALPSNHPMRPWIELLQIQTFLPWKPMGPIISGEEKDSSDLLQDFITEHAGTDAALVARYLWLYDAQAQLPPAEVNRLARELERDFRANRTLIRQRDLADFCATLALLGKAADADGRHETLDFSQTTTPYHIRIETNPKGEIILRNNDKWRVNEYKDFALSGGDLLNEAKVALAMQGRGHRGSHVQTSWLEKFPNSISLASYAAWGVMGSVESKIGLIFEDGETDEEPNDTVHERTLNYIVNAIEYWLPQVRNEAQFHHVDYVLSYLFPALFSGTHGLCTENSWVLHEQMKARMEETARRLGITNASKVKPRDFMLDWRKLNPEEVARQQEDCLSARPRFYIDWQQKSGALQTTARISILGDPPTHRDWWQQLNVEWNNTLSYRDFSTAHVLPHLPILRKEYTGGDLTDDERAFLLDVGTILLWGWRFAEAEEIFTIAATAPHSFSSEDGIRRALQGNAWFQLARLHRQSGQKVEAMSALAELLMLTEGLTVPLFRRVKPTFRRELERPPTARSNLRSLAMRLVEELRFEPDRAALSANCGVFALPTRQLDNPEVNFFYRIPPENKPADGILVVLPGFNEGAAHWLENDNFLAQFAEANDLAMLVPQFYQPLTLWMADHPCSPYHFPQLWSGELMGRALDQFQEMLGVRAASVHLVGFGAGAQFASRLARWRPRMVATLSANFPLNSPWSENEKGLQPLPAMRGIPVQIIASSFHDFGASSHAPVFTAGHFHRALVGEGVEASLLEFDTSPHRVDESVQAAITTFLTNQKEKTSQ